MTDALAAYQERRREWGETGLVRETHIAPSYTRQRLAWIVRGDLGAVEFHYDWKPEWEDDAWVGNDFDLMHYNCAGVEGHHPEPRHEGDEPLPWDCTIIGVPCYPDGTSMGGSEMWEDYCRTLEDAARFTPAIFRALEGYYRDWFGDED
jgi:hypothetical protein